MYKYAFNQGEIETQVAHFFEISNLLDVASLFLISYALEDDFTNTFFLYI